MEVANLFREARSLEKKKKYDEAEETLKTALEKAKEEKDKLVISVVWNKLGMLYKCKGDPDEAHVAFLEAIGCSEEPQNDVERKTTAAPLINLAELFRSKDGKSDKAVERACQARDLLEACSEVSPELAMCYDIIGLIHSHDEDIEDAENAFKRAIEIRSSLPSKDSDENDSEAVSYEHLGKLYTAHRKTDDAILALKRAVEIQTNAKDQRPLLFAATCADLATLYLSVDKHLKALSFFDQCLKVQLAELKQDDARIAVTLNNMGLVYEKIGDVESAKSCFEDAIYIFGELKETHPDTPVAYENLGSLFYDTERWKDALEMYLRAEEVYRNFYEESHQVFSPILKKISALSSKKGDMDKAIETLMEAARLDGINGDKEGEAVTLNNLGLLYHQANHLDNAVESYKRSMELKETVFGSDHREMGVTLHNWAVVKNKLGRVTEATTAAERALEIRDGGVEREWAATAIFLATLYSDQQRYAEALPLMEKALPIKERIIGKEEELGTAYNNLGLLFEKAGRLDEARGAYKRSLEYKEKLFGKKHPQIAITLTNLGEVYQTLSEKKPEEADKYIERARKLLEEALGIQTASNPQQDDEKIIATCRSLSHVYKSAGMYDKALPLLQRVLVFDQSRVGQDHPSNVVILMNIAFIFGKVGKHDEAVETMQTCLKLCEDITHPETATVCYQLAKLYATKGRWVDAEPLLRRCLKLREITLKTADPELSAVLNMLGHVLQEKGDIEDAERMLRRCIATHTAAGRVRGKEAASCYHNLGTLLSARGQLEEAEELLQKAIKIREEIFGEESLEVVPSLEVMGLLCRRQNKLRHAEAHFQKTLLIRAQAWGDNHEDVGTSCFNLGDVYRTLGELVKGRALLEKALAIRMRKFGKHSPKVASVSNALGLLHFKSSRFDEAERCYRQFVEIQERLLEELVGADNPNQRKRALFEVGTGYHNLGVLHQQQKKYDVAEEYFRKSLSLRLEAKDGVVDGELGRTYKSLGTIFKKQGRMTEAKEMFDKCPH